VGCTDTRPYLADFIEDNLESAKADDIRDHVRTCPECGAELKALADVGMLLMEWRPPEPPKQIWERIAAELPKPVDIARPLGQPFRVAMAGVAACMVFVVAWAVGIRPILDTSYVGTPAAQATERTVEYIGTPANTDGANILDVPKKEAVPVDSVTNPTEDHQKEVPGARLRVVPPLKTQVEDKTSKGEPQNRPDGQPASGPEKSE
jgi:hypothetical protein